ncbi:hypothetical protein P7K49_012863 [Saguinus oedipus]|uniref:Uncharacterized protein n=1 Tax=Saguinus oedipus TaxID=9490 RepID=A0ABQ9VED3_SAGOE|nr:hypothetical protein P7K49_012863 [Saguinus oedipus]
MSGGRAGKDCMLGELLFSGKVLVRTPHADRLLVAQAGEAPVSLAGWLRADGTHLTGVLHGLGGAATWLVPSHSTASAETMLLEIVAERYNTPPVSCARPCPSDPPRQRAVTFPELCGTQHTTDLPICPHCASTARPHPVTPRSMSQECGLHR